MSVQTRLVLATLCVFNGVVLTVLGIASAVFVGGPARAGLAVLLWSAALALFLVARRLRRDVEWH